ncbi:hypothetical protein OG372_26720 [Streptomyces sp. NBC_01020]|uniref:hypothetical protein n=1 Tax=unclassified Streptomyces TaxID=2593676 RepID=UPI003246D67B|nr:hypothetical protein OG372_26720 [Streptomyces sp. NBC_01020]
MTSRRARRTVRSAGLVAVAAAAAFSLTACGSGDSNAAGQGTKDSAATSASHSTGNAGAAGDSKTDGSKAGGSQAGASKAGGSQGGGDQSIADKSGTTAEAGPSLDHSQRLPDGSTAKIYQVGAQKYRADIVSHGSVLGSMVTHNTDAGLDFNDMFIVLGIDGSLHSWMGGGHQGPGTFTVAGDWKVKVTEPGEGHYRAQIIGHDGVAATLDANEHDEGLDANGIYMVLSASGVLSAHA